MTVDELRWYSRRRPNDLVRDNLQLEVGSLKDITSEYRYSFRAPTLVARSLGDLASHVGNDKENLNMRRCSSHSEELSGKSVTAPNYRFQYRPRGDLRLEGDMLFQTEKRAQFIEYVLSKRPDLLRRKTQLKLEGDIDTLTENKDKFIMFENCHRPPLAKRDTNLHLEGDFLHFPEYKDVFVEFPRHRPITLKPNPWLHVNNEDKMNTFSETFSQFIEHEIPGTKPEILRRPTNLKCEGDFDLVPEYTKSFKPFPIDRRSSIRQEPNLKLEGELYANPEYKEKYTALPSIKLQPAKHADTLILDDDMYKPPVQNNSVYIPSHANTQNVPKNPEESLPVSTDNKITSRKPPSPRRMESPKLFSTDTRANLEDFKKRKTEYSKSKPIEKLSEDRLTGRPPKSRRSRTNSRNASPSPRNEKVSENFPSKEQKVESNNKVYEYKDMKRMGKLKSPENILTDDKLECQPEYRKAYVDYLIRERLPRNRSPEERVEGKPPINLKWIKRPENQDPPFEVLHKKSGIGENKRYGTMNNENSYSYKPSSRRASITSTTSPRRRSDSPTYRLHVTNVDEPKKGFGPRQHRRGIGNAKSISPTRQRDQIRAQMENNIIPRETGRRQWQKHNDFQYNSYVPNYRETLGKESFVVLDKHRTPANNGMWNSRWYRRSDE